MFCGPLRLYTLQRGIVTVDVSGCPSQGLEEQACGGLSIEIPLMVNKNSTEESESLTFLFFCTATVSLERDS